MNSRTLLENALTALNEVPRRTLRGSVFADTYELAGTISAYLARNPRKAKGEPTQSAGVTAALDRLKEIQAAREARAPADDPARLSGQDQGHGQEAGGASSRAGSDEEESE